MHLHISLEPLLPTLLLSSVPGSFEIGQGAPGLLRRPEGLLGCPDSAGSSKVEKDHFLVIYFELVLEGQLEADSHDLEAILD